MTPFYLTLAWLSGDTGAAIRAAWMLSGYSSRGERPEERAFLAQGEIDAYLRRIS